MGGCSTGTINGLLRCNRASRSRRFASTPRSTASSRKRTPSPAPPYQRPANPPRPRSGSSTTRTPQNPTSPSSRRHRRLRRVKPAGWSGASPSYCGRATRRPLLPSLFPLLSSSRNPPPNRRRMSPLFPLRFPLLLLPKVALVLPKIQPLFHRLLGLSQLGHRNLPPTRTNPPLPKPTLVLRSIDRLSPIRL